MQHSQARTILVGVDGSQGSVEALKWAGALAEHLGMKITAAMAWKHAPEPTGSVTPRRPPDEIEHQLMEQLHRAVDAASLENVDCLPLRGQAHDALQKASTRADVAMLIVGTRGLGLISGLLLGSVSRKLLFSVKCPLILVPHGSHHRVDHVVVGLDGSPVSDTVAAWSAALCSRSGASASIVRCIEAGAEHSTDRLDEIMTVSHLSFDKDHCKVFRGLGVPHEPVVKDGDPRVCLIEKAKKENAGLIVVGQHGTGQFSGLGGTASYLVRHSPLPLAIIPSSPDAA